MTKVVCKMCILSRGLSGTDMTNWPEADSPNADEWLYAHIEREHAIRVRGPNETAEHAMARPIHAYPRSGEENDP